MHSRPTPIEFYHYRSLVHHDSPIIGVTSLFIQFCKLQLVNLSGKLADESNLHLIM